MPEPQVRTPGPEPEAPVPFEEVPGNAAFSAIRRSAHRIIFKADTAAGRAFDIALVWAILISVAAVLLESVAELRAKAGTLFDFIEWTFTILFSVEYCLRLASLRKPFAYARSFFGIVDILSFLPTYLGLFIPGAQAFSVVRVFRFLRLFRIFKLVRYMREARVLLTALRASLPKITVFLTALTGIVICMGALMYLVEGEANGFTSMPKSIYWAISTLSTVGYGDVTPKTPAGQAIAALVMLLGYSILAVPTGIVSVEIAQASRRMQEERPCPRCGLGGHESDSAFCRRCGSSLHLPARLP
ncbi:MAG: transporter, cation channel family [Fibrobacteres bacterium]|nr:transporter, cation channel family [Fibrobacterota bacterium]